MALRKSGLRFLNLQGTIDPAGGVAQDIQWSPTGIDLDAERPRAMLIERVTAYSPVLQIDAAQTFGRVSLIAALSTGRVARDSNAPRNRLILADRRIGAMKDAASSAGANSMFEAGNNLGDLEGTLWVAPYIGFIASVNNLASTLTAGRMTVTYRVVDIPFDLAHALYDQLDECTDQQLDWWNV